MARTSRSTTTTSTQRRRTHTCGCSTSTLTPPFPTKIWSATNAARGGDEPEYELIDTGIFDDDRYSRRVRRVRQGRHRTTSWCASPRRIAVLMPRHSTSCRTSGSATRGGWRRMSRSPRCARGMRRKALLSSNHSIPRSANTISTAKAHLSCCSPRTRAMTSCLFAATERLALRKRRCQRIRCARHGATP